MSDGMFEVACAVVIGFLCFLIVIGIYGAFHG